MTSIETNTQDLTFVVTDNLSLAAYYLCNNCTLEKIITSPDISGKLLFIFTPRSFAKKLEKKFFSFHAKVTPQPYYQAIQQLKRMLIEFKNNNYK